MEIPSKIHKVCATKSGRYAMASVAYDPSGCGPITGPCLVATDGRRAVVVGVTADEGAPDKQVLIPREAVEAAHKATRGDKHKRPPVLSLSGSVIAPHASGAPTWAYTEGEFPRLAPLIPRGEPHVRVNLNARYLHEIAEALGSEGWVELELRKGPGPVVVRAYSFGSEPALQNRIGILMPIGNGTEIAADPISPPTVELATGADGVAVPEVVTLTAGQKAAATRKRNEKARKERKP